MAGDEEGGSRGREGGRRAGGIGSEAGEGRLARGAGEQNEGIELDGILDAIHLWLGVRDLDPVLHAEVGEAGVVQKVE